MMMYVCCGVESCCTVQLQPASVAGQQSAWLWEDWVPTEAQWGTHAQGLAA